MKIDPVAMFTLAYAVAAVGLIAWCNRLRGQR